MVLRSTKPPVELVPGTVSAGGKVFSAEVKNEWSPTYILQYAFMARPGAEN